jgi:phosphoribosyl-ATP pyrophosphohydrolase/phosphoribosyl-AMP cyclohydrolase
MKAVELDSIGQLDWDKGNGLLPVIVQHAATGAVLMLAYVNQDALRATLERGRAVFFSRTRGRLWEKGETTGHTLELQSLRMDCDRDTLLLLALPRGPVCHTGTNTCFGDGPFTAAESLAFLGELEQVIAQRIAAGPEGSYTAQLYQRGMKRMAQKVGEEGLETALAAVGESDAEFLGEAADLLFHLEVLLQARKLQLADVVAQLRARHADRAPPAAS